MTYTLLNESFNLIQIIQISNSTKNSIKSFPFQNFGIDICKCTIFFDEFLSKRSNLMPFFCT